MKKLLTLGLSMMLCLTTVTSPIIAKSRYQDEPIYQVILEEKSILSPANSSNRTIQIQLEVGEQNEEGEYAARGIGNISNLGDFHAVGSLQLIQGVYLGFLYEDNANAKDNHLALSIHYDTLSDNLVVNVTEGFLNDTSAPRMMSFGETNLRIEQAVKTDIAKRQEQKTTSYQYSTPIRSSQNVERRAFRNSADGLILDLYGPATLTGQGTTSRVAVSTKVNDTLMESYMRNQGYSVSSGASGCTKVSASLYVERASGLVAIMNSHEPNPQSTSLEAPIPVSYDFSSWITNNIPNLSVSVNAYRSNISPIGYSWSMTRFAEMTNYIMRSKGDGLGFCFQFSRENMTSATKGKVSADVTAACFITTTDYVRVPISLRDPISYQINLQL